MNLHQAFAQMDKPQKSGKQEYKERTESVDQLVHDIVGRNVEFFADPANRLNFIKDQTAKDYFYMAQYIDAKLRGEKPHELREYQYG